MLKGLYIIVACAAAAPLIVLQTVVSILVWDSKSFDNVFATLIYIIEDTLNIK